MAEYSGGLKVRVFGGSIAEPVSSAEVSVTDDTGEILYKVYTDSSGESEVMTLAAPDPVNSEDEGTGMPYYTYNVSINADGYRPLRIEGVQIFPDVISVQDGDLEKGSGEEIRVTVPAPVLTGGYPEKIPEEEVKDVPEDTGFVVLDRVVVPEFVVPCFRVVVINCYNLLKRDVYRVF